VLSKPTKECTGHSFIHSFIHSTILALRTLECLNADWLLSGDAAHTHGTTLHKLDLHDTAQQGGVSTPWAQPISLLHATVGGWTVLPGFFLHITGAYEP
jgi:hypothetical protein